MATQDSPIAAPRTRAVLAEVIAGGDATLYGRHWEALAKALGAPPEAGVRAGTTALKLDATMREIGFDPEDKKQANETLLAAFNSSSSAKHLMNDIGQQSGQSKADALLTSVAIDAVLERHPLGEAIRPQNGLPLEEARQTIVSVEKSPEFAAAYGEREERSIAPNPEREEQAARVPHDMDQRDRPKASAEDLDRVQSAEVQPEKAEGKQASHDGDRPADRAKAAVSVKKGDVPDALRNRYLVEVDKITGDCAFHKDAKGPCSFKDCGSKLVTREPNSEVVRDMIVTAQHRGWSEIKVAGDEEFKRQVWFEAKLKGLDVVGFKPTELDRKELDKLLDARHGRSIEPAAARGNGQDVGERQEGGNTGRGGAAARPDAAERPDYDAGVSGKLVATGSAPYQHVKGNEASAYVTLEGAGGKQTHIWGVGLPEAVQRSGAEIGDNVTVRRDGMETVTKNVKTTDKTTGQTVTEPKEVQRNRWEVLADRFKDSSPAQAARDPETREAQATLRVLEVALKERVSDKGLVEKLMQTAKAHVTASMRAGGTFKEARVRDEMRKDPSPRNARQVARTAARVDDRKRANEARGEKALTTKRAKVDSKRQDLGRVKKAPERSRSR